MPPRAALALAALAVLAAAPARGQDRPSEDELFGAPAVEAPAPPAPAEKERGERGRTDAEKAARPEEAQLFGAPPAAQAAPPPPQGIVSRERDDTLRIGGQLYLRAAAAAVEDQQPGDFALSSPNLLDVYLDARPNDRVRAFVLGRLTWDPTLPPPGAPSLPEASFTGASGFVLGGDSDPRGVLDQLWVNFDVERVLFVTAGRQHVKWGVGRFWNPTDFLHPVRRNPLAVFDERTGTAMVKLHLPWEARGWNAYGVAVLEDVAGAPEPARRVGRVGVGGRAEVVVGLMELGLDALAQDGHRPRFGVDVSAGVWDLDLYAEAAFRTSVDTPRWREADPTAPLFGGRFVRADPIGPMAQVVAGGSWSAKYSDEDVVTLGAEYFYDESGYESPRLYPVLFGVGVLGAAPATIVIPTEPPTEFANPVAGEPSPFTPFYLGRHYGAAFVSLPAAGSWNDTTLTLSVLGNLSDKSFVARLDHSVLALTYLRIETFLAGHFGAREGEFRAGFDFPPEAVALGFPPRTEPLVLQAGVALRVSL
jgi:hypothetical protein